MQGISKPECLAPNESDAATQQLRQFVVTKRADDCLQCLKLPKDCNTGSHTHAHFSFRQYVQNTKKYRKEKQNLVNKQKHNQNKKNNKIKIKFNFKSTSFSSRT